MKRATPKLLKKTGLLALGLSLSLAQCTNSFDPTDVPPIDQDAPITYKSTTPNAFNLTKIGAVMIPSRIKVSPNGKWLFVATLPGGVIVFKKDADTWTQQETYFHDLGDLGVSGERGLTGLCLSEGFDEESEDPVKRDVFLTYQQRANGESLNRITRLTATLDDTGNLYGQDAELIYEGPQPSAEAHQIQECISFTYEGAPHLLVSVGDGFETSDALDPSIEGHGKVLLMQRDGSDPLGERPWPEHPKIAAIGIRNTYGMSLLPASQDSRRRVFGAENGNGVNDRLWFIEIVEFDSGNDEKELAQVSLGYTGSDEDESWMFVPDLNAGFVTPETVLELITPIHAPTSTAFHPGGGVIPESVPDSSASMLVACYGKSNSTSNDRKGIYLVHITNLGNQTASTFDRIIERVDEAEGSQGAPVAMDVDPTTGDIYFADIVTGEINRAVINE